MPAMPVLKRAVAGLVILFGTAVNLQSPAWAASAHIIELRIAHRAVTVRDVVGDRVVRVTEGQEVEIRWQSDEEATIHLHGYDIMTEIAAGGEAVMRFSARAAGRFPIEAHSIGTDKNVHVVLVYLEVYPP
jgi:hypothetical protein